MNQSLIRLALLFCLVTCISSGKILRNNALMSQMVSNFRAPPQERVMELMRNVLCKNFPSIPCKVITKDDALRELIKKTVALLKDKQRKIQKATEQPDLREFTTVPVVNSEELAHYLAVENTGYFTYKHKQDEKRQLRKPKTEWSEVDNEQAPRRAALAANKNIRKYFPHKIKYKDKNRKNGVDSSREKRPTSEEGAADAGLKHNYSYRTKQGQMPMWQIDYTKHGEPRLPTYSQETDLFKGKLVKVAGDSDNTILKHRKGVLHPNLYIKNSARDVIR